MKTDEPNLGMVEPSASPDKGANMADYLIISHQSALLAHRAVGTGLLDGPLSNHSTPRDTHTSRLADYLESGNVTTLLEAGPLHTLALSQTARHSSKQCISHLCEAALPQGSLQSIGNHVLVSSPSLTLIQISQACARNAKEALPWCEGLIDEFGDFGITIALAELCGELCGYYSIAPDGKGTLKRHRRLVKREDLLAYIAKTRRMRGAPLAARAARMAPSLSASPRETAVFLVMTAPWPIGYGFEAPATNEPIFLKGQSDESDDDCTAIRFSDYRWMSKTLRSGRKRRCITLEYDSDEFHTADAGLTDRQLKDQGERRDAIEAAGNGYLRVTTDHTRDFEQFDFKMHQLAKLLRVDLPPRSSDEKQQAKAFQEALFGTTRFKLVGNLMIPVPNHSV